MAIGIARLFSRLSEATASKGESAAARKIAESAHLTPPSVTGAQDKIAAQADKKAASLEDAQQKFQVKKRHSDADKNDAIRGTHDIIMLMPKAMDDPNSVRVALSQAQKTFPTERDELGNSINRQGQPIQPLTAVTKGVVDGLVEQRAELAGMSPEKYAEPTLGNYLKASKSTMAPLAAPVINRGYKVFKAMASSKKTEKAGEITARRAEKLRQLQNNEARVVTGKLGIGTKRIYNQDDLQQAVEAARKKPVSLLNKAEINAVRALQTGPSVAPLEAPTFEHSSADYLDKRNNLEQHLITQHQELQGSFHDAYDARTTAQKDLAYRSTANIFNDPKAPELLATAERAFGDGQFSAAGENLGKIVGRGVDIDATSNLLSAQNTLEHEANRFLPVHQKLVGIKTERNLEESLNPFIDKENGDVFYDAQESQSTFENQDFVSSIFWPNKQTQALNKTHQEMQAFYELGRTVPSDIPLIPASTQQFVERGLSFLKPSSKQVPTDTQ
jgi:hypothetical protein